MRRNPRPSWLDDPTERSGALAAIARHNWHFTEPSWMRLPDGRNIPLARYARDLRRFEADLDLELWQACDDAGFAWVRPHHPLPAASASIGRPVTRDLVASDQATFAEVLAFQEQTNTNDVDAFIPWIQRGLDIVNKNNLRIPILLGEPERIDPATGFPLGAWAQELARAERRGYVSRCIPGLPRSAAVCLGPRCRVLLRNIGLVLEFRDQFGHANVPRSHLTTLVDGTPYDLGAWVKTRRYRATRESVPSPTTTALEALGVRLTPRSSDATWEAVLAYIDAHRAEYGNRRVPANAVMTMPDGQRVRVGAAILRARQQYDRGELPSQRAQDLRDRGIDPALILTPETRWELGIAALDAYIAATGNPNPDEHATIALPDGSVANVGTWLAKRRFAYQRGGLPDYQRTELEARGVTLAPLTERRAEAVRLFQAFVAREGHALVPSNHVEYRADGTPYRLGHWVDGQRKLYRHGRMPADWQAELTELGFCFSALDTTFELRLDAYDRFIARTGSTYVPLMHRERMPDGSLYTLGHWCQRLRTRYAEGKLDPARIAALNDRGFPWDPQGIRFGEGLVALRHYLERTGTTVVPRGHVEVLDDGSPYPLSNWIRARQAALYRGALPEDQRAMLADLGCRWAATERSASTRSVPGRA